MTIGVAGGTPRVAALLAQQPLDKLVFLSNEIGGCDQSPFGRMLEGALAYAIDTKAEENVSEDEVYALLDELRALGGAR